MLYEIISFIIPLKSIFKFDLHISIYQQRFGGNVDDYDYSIPICQTVIPKICQFCHGLTLVIQQYIRNGVGNDDHTEISIQRDSISNTVFIVATFLNKFYVLFLDGHNPRLLMSFLVCFKIASAKIGVVYKM